MNDFNQPNTSDVAPFPAIKRTPELDLDFSFILNVLKNRYKIIAGCTIAALILAFAFLQIQKPLYTATAVLQLNTQDQILLDMNSMVLSRTDDTSSLNTEIDIIRSRTVSRRVIDKLGLKERPEFDVSGIEDPERAQIKAVNMFQDRLSVKKDPLSYTVKLSFTSETPDDAKEIVNTLAEEYLAFQIEARYESARRAYQWLNERVEDLRAEVIATENAVQDFSIENNLLEVDGRPAENDQLKALNNQLSRARQDYATAKAKAEQITALRESGQSLSSLPEVLNSSLIQNLRVQEATLARESSELANQFGPRHPRTSEIDRQLRDIRGKIGAEISRITQGITKQVEIAEQREATARQEIESIQSTSGSAKGFKIQLDNLKREADATRELYEAFLTRMKETGEAENLEQVNAKIINLADLPLRPSSPNKPFILALSLLAGLSGGLAGAFLLSHIYRGFLNPVEIEDYLGLSCIGMVPEVSKKQIMADMRMDHPSSAHAEALRTLIASLKLAKGDNIPKSILIISSIPEEGKGWLSTSLARIVAKSGKKVLLLDCDMHRRMSLDVPANDPVKSLNDYLAGNAEFHEIVKVEEGTGTHYIGSSPETRNLQELLESERMKTLMDHAHNEYDMIIVDSPPVIGMSDVLFLAQIVDTALLAVRWMDTPRNVVENALRTLSRARIPLFGAVMTRVNFEQFKRSEYGARKYYQQYGQYYKSQIEEDNRILKISDKVS
ncbi:MAG: Wzz/FepE/Etk N-terminal domain-containing protein [Pseudomonadota bacterium]